MLRTAIKAPANNLLFMATELLLLEQEQEDLRFF